MSSADRHRRLRELFLRARELPTDARGTFLDAECGAEPDLRGEVDRLLEHDERPIPFVEAASRGGGAELVRELMTGESAALDHPATIGRYRILGVIGEGGMGTVYEARQEEPRRKVALKVIRPGLASESILRRFRREVQVLGQLKHPGIARIYEAGTAEDNGGRPFFAMELVTGLPLIEYAERKGLGVRERLALIAQICDAVQHAHEHGIIHRDLKPRNILVEELATTESREGASRSGNGSSSAVAEVARSKVLDFGVARVIDPDVDTMTLQTSTGQLVGTLPYMSPEQASGDGSELDARTDVYSLGVITFELLSGRLPYDVHGKTIPEAARIICEENPSRLGSVDKLLRGEVEVIIAKALAKERERRYATAAELAADIRRFLRDVPIHARPTSAVYQLRKFAKRHRGIAAGITVAFLAMFIATVVSLGLLRVARKQHALASERADALEASSWRAYRSLVASAASALQLGDPVAARGFLDNTPSTHRGWEYDYLVARLDPSLARLELDEEVRAATFLGAGAGVVTATAGGRVLRLDPYLVRTSDPVQLDAALTGPAAFSRDARRIAGVVGADRREAVFWDGDSGRRLASLRADETSGLSGAGSRRQALSRLAIAPDGARVALTVGVAGAIWDPPGGRTWPLPRQPMRAFGFGPESDVLTAYLKLTNEHRGYAHTFDARTGQHLARSRIFGGEVRGIAVSPRDALVLLGTDDGRAHLFVDRELVHVDAGHEGAVAAVAIAPGGGRVATGSLDGSIRVWSPKSPEEVTVFDAVGGPVSGLAFAEDGARLLSVAGNELQVLDLAGKDRVSVLRGHRRYVYGVAFGAGGSRILSCAWDGAVRIWDARSGEPVATLQGTGRHLGLASCPNGPVFATCGEKGLVIVHDASTGRVLHRLVQGDGYRVTGLALTAEGTLLAYRTQAGIDLWDPRSGERLREIPARGHDSVSAIALSPDGTLVAADDRFDVVLWRTDTGEEVARFEGHSRRPAALAFDPSGERLASGACDNTVRLWDVRNGAAQAVMTGHAGIVYAVAFSPDGTRLASGSDDRTIRLWDVERGDEVLTLLGHGEYVYSLAFSPDGSMLVSGSGDDEVRVWDEAPVHERWMARAERAARRETLRPLVLRLLAEEPDVGRIQARLREDANLTREEREDAQQLVLELGLAPEGD